MADDWGIGIKPTEKKEDKNVFNMDSIKEMIKEGSGVIGKPVMNCLVMGDDGVGKSGIVLDYCSKLPKKTMIIDLDGGNLPLLYEYYKDNNKFIVPRILETTISKDGLIDIDYVMTMTRIKGLIKYVVENQNEFSAIVLDGLSTLLKHAEYQSRIDKNISVDGGMQLRYWLNRNKFFTEIIEIMKSASLIDKFYIGHSDLIANKDSASVKQKLNAMVHQRIICERNDNLGKVEFSAKIDKSKFNLSLEGQKFIFATVESGKTTWNVNLFEELTGKKKVIKE